MFRPGAPNLNQADRPAGHVPREHEISADSLGGFLVEHVKLPRRVRPELLAQVGLVPDFPVADTVVVTVGPALVVVAHGVRADVCPLLEVVDVGFMHDLPALIANSSRRVVDRQWVVASLTRTEPVETFETRIANRADTLVRRGEVVICGPSGSGGEVREDDPPIGRSVEVVAADRFDTELAEVFREVPDRGVGLAGPVDRSPVRVDQRANGACTGGAVDLEGPDSFPVGMKLGLVLNR